MRFSRTLLGTLVAAAAMAGVTASSEAAPLPTHVAAMKALAGSDTLQVRWGWGGGWRGGWGGGWGYRGFGPRGWGAVAAGALIGGAIASSTYYGSYPAYGYGSYGSYPAYYGGSYGGGYAYPGCYPYGGGYGYGGYSRAYYGW